MKSEDPANVLVLCIVIAFVSFVVYVAVKSQIEEKKDKEHSKSGGAKLKTTETEFFL